MAKLKTGRHTSSLKEARAALRRRRTNTTARIAARGVAKELRTAIQNKDAEAVKTLLPKAMSSWTKMGNRHQLHPAAASRKIGRLSRSAHKALSAA